MKKSARRPLCWTVRQGVARGWRGWAGRRLVRILTLALLGLFEATSLVVAYAIAPLPSRAISPTPTAGAKAQAVSSWRFHPPADAEVTPTPAATATAAPVATAAPAVSVPPPRPFPFQAGVNVLVYGNDPAFAAKAATQLDHLAQLHVNSVSFVFPIYQNGWTASTVYADPAMTPTNTNIRTFIRLAHQRHLRVMIRPLMDEANFHPAGKWRGAIAPSIPSAWFASYTALVVGYGRLAQAEGAELFDIGTEFDSMQGYTQSWLNVIAAQRHVYSGQLTYSANWAIQYPAFGWSVDFLSIDAFFPLAVPVNATQPQLAAAWGRWIARASSIGYAYGKHVVFTELGTTSEVGSFQSPWLWGHGTGLSLEAQRLYYAASCQVLKSHMGGLYWWEFDLQPLAAPLTDTSFNPQGKPAEAELGRCY
ncbi:MAG TPA: hypothetical protein VET26_03885 [Candidatus Sulfotelmatobacter sp.]|nr:hypothetical protein [Candidatus Sulfotelmatobacter sp.]